MSTEQNVRALFELFGEMTHELEGLFEDDVEPSPDFRVKGYGELYEQPIKKIAAFLFQEAGLWDAVIQAAESSDPNASIIEFARTAKPAKPLTPENSHLALIALVVLLVNLEAIAAFNAPMAELLGRVEQGDDSALFSAVVLDPSVLHSKPAADRISKAALLDDRSFFDALAKAITRTKPVRPKTHLDGVRILMNILDDAGELQKMTDLELTNWAVDKLGIYPGSGDPLSAVRDQRRKRERVKQGPKS